MENKTYLGDGLYAQFDGFQFVLSTQRATGEHFVALDPSTTMDFIRFIEKTWNVTIKLEKNKEPS